MKTNGLITSVTPVAAAFALAMLVQPIQTAAVGRGASLYTGVEIKITGPIFAVPDHTADIDSDQCRSTNVDSEKLLHRMTTLDLTALGHSSFVGPYRRAFTLDFGAKSAIAGDLVTFNFWVNKNCLLTAVGRISLVSPSGWPLAADRARLVVEVPAGAAWTFKSVGGGSAPCSLETTLTQPVQIVCTRNDARLNTACDCPFDYIDANGNMIADECE